MPARRPKRGFSAPPVRELSFDAIFRAHFDFVWRCARSFVGESCADDVTQEAFLLVRRRLEAFDADALRPWLYGITRNAARNWNRARQRRARRHRALVELEPAHGERWEQVREAANLMDRFLLSLPVAQSEAFRLKVIEEFTAAEIATCTGVPLQTVYSRVRAANIALARFRTALEDDA
ncbi:MAG: sigma-70 family RNA polymerase sigma factor [Nannocystaceae bacterium]|nr:sigma-70 family RNA polymerase sigma factor [Nannocystaceae bacterium]